MPCYEVGFQASTIVLANDKYDALDQAGEPNDWHVEDAGVELDNADCRHLNICPECCLPLVDGVCEDCEKKNPE